MGPGKRGVVMHPVVPVVGALVEALRGRFVESVKPPIGGRVAAVEHRPGVDVTLDGLWAEGCSGLVWVNVVSLFRSMAFPEVSQDPSPCGGVRCATVQVGAARCVSMVDESGYPPSVADMEHDAVVGLDDAARLEAAVCEAVRVCRGRGVVSAAVQSPVEPVGPEGGVLAWIMTVTVEFA